MIILSRVVVSLFFFISVGAAEIFSANFVSAAEKIDINTAPLEDLVKIIHIGETRARELIFLRPFSSLNDLTKIKGIGEARLRDIEEQGLAWINLQLQPEPKPEPEPQPEPESEKPAVEKPTVDAKHQQTYPAGVEINEILPSPEGQDAEEEWIEVFNQNNFEIDLSDWQITDTAGRTTTYTLPIGIKISAKGFLVLSRPESKITLNNDGDGLLLIQPNGNILDSVNYGKAPRGQSYNRTESDWVWGSILTPGSVNVISAPQPARQEEEEKESEAEFLSKSKKDLAAIGEQTPGTFNSLPIFLIALGLAIFSGAIIFILKKKIKSNQ